MKKLCVHCKILEQIITDTFWMARRYAHGRQTMAPDTIREAFKMLQKLDIKIDDDRTLEPKQKEDCGLREDYLDDLVWKKKINPLK